jgi:hypothetical protein
MVLETWFACDVLQIKESEKGLKEFTGMDCDGKYVY